MIFNHNENGILKHTHSKSDVGLGNVPNVATNDQTPTYTQASTLENLTSGEKMSVSMGKIMKGLADLISHLTNKQNPHGVTASQVGAAASNHTHDYAASGHSHAWSAITGKPSTFTPATHSHAAGDITSGVLPVARGGTGQTSLTNLVMSIWPSNVTPVYIPTFGSGWESRGYTSLATLATQLAANGLAKVVVGTYTGDGSESRTISLGVTPKAVLVMKQDGSTYYKATSNSNALGGLAVTGSNAIVPAGTTVAITTNGFVVACKGTYEAGYAYTNSPNQVYHYIAIV